MPPIPLFSVPFPPERVLECRGSVIDWSGAIVWTPMRAVVFELDSERAVAVLGNEAGTRLTVLVEYYADLTDCYSTNTGDDVVMRIKGVGEQDEHFLTKATRAFVAYVKQQ